MGRERQFSVLYFLREVQNKESRSETEAPESTSSSQSLAGNFGGKYQRINISQMLECVQLKENIYEIKQCVGQIKSAIVAELTAVAFVIELFASITSGIYSVSLSFPISRAAKLVQFCLFHLENFSVYFASTSAVCVICPRKSCRHAAKHK